MTPLRRARASVAVAYAVQGVCFAALVTRIPALKDRFDLSDASLALLLAVVPIVAGAGSVLAGVAAPRVGSAVVLRVMGPVVPLSLVAVGSAPTLGVLVAVLVLVGLGLGSVDAAMNMQGVQVQEGYGRSVMGSFYAVFSLAGIVGALLASVAASSELTLAAFFGIVAVVVVPAQLIVGPWLLRGASGTAASEAEVVRPHVTVPWGPIAAIGVVLTCVYVADSSASNWSAVYLTDELGSTESVAALGYACYALATLLGRTVVDRLVARTGPVALVRGGGLLAAAAALGVALAPGSPAALAAFAVLGLAVAPVIPLAFTAAAEHDPLGSGVAVARVNVFNYVGFVLGAPLVGVVAESSSLRWGFAVLVPVLLLVPLLAGSFRPLPRVPEVLR